MNQHPHIHNDFLKTLPEQPGVYQMHSSNAQIIYIGKAKNLKKRVSQYFSKSDHAIKTQRMVSQVKQVDTIITQSEAEAFILEATLIKRHRPKYNILMRDDKSYPFIYLSQHARPGLFYHRGAQKKPGKYFGPYASAYAVQKTLSFLQKAIPLRQCSDSVFANRSRPCLQYQIHRCSGPCVNKIDEDTYQTLVTQAEQLLTGKSFDIINDLSQQMSQAAQQLEFEQAAKLRDHIQTIRDVQSQPTLNQVSKTDKDYLILIRANQQVVIQVVSLRHEELWQNQSHPLKVPDHLQDATDLALLMAFMGQYYAERTLPYQLVTNIAVDESIDKLHTWLGHMANHSIRFGTAKSKSDKQWVDNGQQNALAYIQQNALEKETQHTALVQLQNWFHLPTLPQRIECFDISHTLGQDTQASCVVFEDGVPANSQYRRFNIRDIEPGDDYAAMRQAMIRRYQKMPLDDLPNLIVIDGGKGQLSQGVQVMTALEKDVALVGVAKGENRKAGLETLFTPQDTTGIQPPKNAPGFLLIQHIRDEAHRFAITGHRKKRQKTTLSSPLDQIPGVGAKTRKKLLQHFGGFQGVKNATGTELQTVPGISAKLAQTIADYLKG